MKLNLNDLARLVTLEETGAKEISIAQTKEVMKILLTELGKYTNDDVIKVINRYRRLYGKMQ